MTRSESRPSRFFQILGTIRSLRYITGVNSDDSAGRPACGDGTGSGPLRQLGRPCSPVGTAAELTDGQLLERFATREGAGAEQAFAALVERHGPMVLRVCRGVLADPHDAEDAFQATFLVLVKKARGLWVNDSLGPWLHQVALRTASCARSAAARRRRHERAAAVAGPARPHRERARRPRARCCTRRSTGSRTVSACRSILCDLEGRTHEQAARHLGWPVGPSRAG